jgi:hypothetical protein
MGRRDYKDAEWHRVKKQVRERDGEICRLLRIISAKQALFLKKNAEGILQKLDPAHIFPVSTHPNLCYEPNNIVLLNRYSHNMLDFGRDPILGEPISHEETLAWWERIAGPEQWEFLQRKIQGDDYE